MDSGPPHGVKGEVREMTMLNDTLQPPAFMEGSRPSWVGSVDHRLVYLVIGMRCVENSMS